MRSGDIAVDLARPVDLQLAWLAADIGRAAFAIGIRAVLPTVVGALTFGFRLPSDTTAVALLPLSLLLAVVVSFACRFAISLAAFWIVDVRGVVSVYVLTSNLLCGLILPLQLFPTWLKTVAHATPFPSMLQCQRTW